MPEQDNILPLTARSVSGTSSARRLRRAGDIPSIIYGLGSDSTQASVKFADLRAALSTAAGRNAILTLDLDGTRETGIVKDIQWHPYREEVLHVDFLRINPDQEITVDTPFLLVGDAHELSLQGGQVEQLVFELSITTKATQIPDNLEIDITHLEIGTSITVGDLKLPGGATTAVDPETVVVQGIMTQTVEVEEAVEEELEGEEPTDEEAGEEETEAAADDE